MTVLASMFDTSFVDAVVRYLNTVRALAAATWACPTGC